MRYSAPARFSSDDGLPVREVQLINHLVRDFLDTRPPHPDLELEELVQECLVHWWRQRPRYSQHRGASLETFLRRVVRNKLRDLERGVRAEKRGGGRQPDSLDRPLNLEEPDADTLEDTIPDPHTDPASEAILQVTLEKARPGSVPGSANCWTDCWMSTPRAN